MRLFLTLSTAAVVAGTAALAQTEQSQTAIALTGDSTLVLIDPTTATVTDTVELTAGRLLGIDWRPNTEQLIGVTNDWQVVNIDWRTGRISTIVNVNERLPIEDGVPVIVEINPSADALRFMSGTVNLRVDLTSGAVERDGPLSFDPQGEHNTQTPVVGGSAYLNSLGRPGETAMYNIDTDMSALLMQSPPNDGTNILIGTLGEQVSGPIGFDIATTADGDNTAWLAANGALNVVDLETGTVTQSWELQGLEGDIRDLAFVPSR